MIKGTRLLALAALCVGATAGCYNAKQVNAFLHEPRTAVVGVEYRVMPPDVIAISSRHVQEIDGLSQQIRPDGKVNLPLVGEVFVAGKTPAEIEYALTEAAKEYYEQVDATVTVQSYNSQKFYVFGQVSKPGPMPWTGRDTLLDALAKAQPTQLAWPERIIVVRGDAPQEGGQAATQPSWKYWRSGVHPERPDSPRRKLTINLMAMVRQGDMANNILLQPNDIIYVQPNPFAKVGLWIQNLLFPIRPAVQTITTPAAAATAL